jgi:hypothetical protein
VIALVDDRPTVSLMKSGLAGPGVETAGVLGVHLRAGDGPRQLAGPALVEAAEVDPDDVGLVEGG